MAATVTPNTRGFSAAGLAQFHDRCQRLTLHDGLPGVDRVGPATLQPARYIKRGLATGGTIVDGQLIPSSRTLRGDPARAVVGWPDSPSRSAPEPAAEYSTGIYGGVLFDHFGHFVLESLCRLWQDPRGTPVFMHNWPRNKTGFAAQMVQLAAQFDIRIVPIDTPICVHQLTVPHPDFVVRNSIHAQAGATPRALAKALMGKPPAASDQPLYLARTAWADPRSRKIVGERQLVEQLEASGWRILHPESLSVAEQIRAVNSHQTVVGCAGSAMHLVNFTLHQPRVVYLSDETPNTNFVLWDWANGVETTYLSVLTQPPVVEAARLSDYFAFSFPFELDAEKAANLLANLGLPPVDRPGEQPAERRNAYRQAWFQTAIRRAVAARSTSNLTALTATVESEFANDTHLRSSYATAAAELGVANGTSES